MEPRAPEHCLLGCCREVAALLCSLACFMGTPTRARIGCAAYFLHRMGHSSPGFSQGMNGPLISRFVC